MDSTTNIDETTQNRYARRCHLRKLIRIDISLIYPRRIPKNALASKASLRSAFRKILLILPGGINHRTDIRQVDIRLFPDVFELLRLDMLRLRE